MSRPNAGALLARPEATGTPDEAQVVPAPATRPEGSQGPSPLGDLGASVEAAFRAWSAKARPCPRCGELGILDRVCWTCAAAEERAAAAAYARRERAWPVLDEHAWATFGALELAERVVARPGLLAHAAEVASRGAVPRQLIIRGPGRMGKTSLAVAMLRAWEATHPGLALFVPAVALAGGGFKLDADLLSAPLVVLDDLGTEKKIASSVVPDLIYERHARALPLWVTTWMSSQETRERYGDGIARRLLERALVLETGER